MESISPLRRERLPHRAPLAQPHFSKKMGWRRLGSAPEQPGEAALSPWVWGWGRPPQCPPKGCSSCGEGEGTTSTGFFPIPLFLQSIFPGNGAGWEQGAEPGFQRRFPSAFAWGRPVRLLAPGPCPARGALPCPRPRAAGRGGPLLLQGAKGWEFRQEASSTSARGCAGVGMQVLPGRNRYLYYFV